MMGVLILTDLPDWPQYDSTQRACLVVDEQPRIVDDPDGETLRAVYGMSASN